MEKYRFERFHLIFGAVFCTLAALLLYAGIANVVKWNKFNETAVPVNAIITEIHEKVGRSGASTEKGPMMWILPMSMTAGSIRGR